MDDTLTISIFAIVVFAISAIAAWLPFVVKKGGEDRLHLLIGFSAGIMLGVLFAMLLPEALERTYDGGYGADEVSYMILLGVSLLLVVDFAVKRASRRPEVREDEESHEITSMSAFAGLAIHSFFDGTALAAAFIAGEDVGALVLVALCMHKAVVAFSLSSTMMMSNRRGRAKYYLLAFCLISPVAAVVSYLAMDTGDMGLAGMALCFSVGIFAFVTLCDMLPEAFHHREGDFRQLGALLLGLAIAIAVAVASGYLMGGIEI